MTNKIEISRELAERLTKDYTGRPNWDALEEDRLAATEELRALLAAPAVERNQCDGCQAGRPVENGNHRMGDGAYPDLMGCTANLYAAVERQEPVAEVQHGPFDDVGTPQWVRVVTLGDFDLEHIPDGTKLWTSPPAPVAMVLPDRKDTVQMDGYQSPWDAGWNACLDKVKEMNK